ncbi:MAG: CehA/McbA family metallohydrolase [Candidatus Scalinduaceae bacterium]
MLKDYKGACHIHTEYSDGKAKITDVITSAKDADLDFVILSDHNTFLPKHDGWEGWHDNLLVIVGMEVSPRRAGHFLALNTRPLAGNGHIDLRKYKYMTSRDCLDDVTDNGGTAFIVHPLGKKKFTFNINLQAWQDWEQNGFAGIEVWSYLHDWIDDLKLSNIWHFYKYPNLQIKGPDPKLLSLWDKLGQKRKIVGISGLDAHLKKIPFMRRPIFTYKELFKTIRTHVLIDHELAKTNEAIMSIYDAQNNGRCYISFDLLADATGFKFFADSGDRIFNMGDEVFNIEDKIYFSIKSPHQATIRLLRNGEICSESEGTFLESSSTEKGVFRVEAYIKNKPWVFTNPIYVR